MSRNPSQLVTIACFCGKGNLWNYQLVMLALHLEVLPQCYLIQSLVNVTFTYLGHSVAKAIYIDIDFTFH